MRETVSNGHQVLSDGNRVWVNGLQGESVARLASVGELVMIDVHRSLAEQRATGGECLDCRHELKHKEAWDYFVTSLKRHFNVTVDERHKPSWATHRT